MDGPIKRILGSARVNRTKAADYPCLDELRNLHGLGPRKSSKTFLEQQEMDLLLGYGLGGFYRALENGKPSKPLEQLAVIARACAIVGLSEMEWDAVWIELTGSPVRPLYPESGKT